MKIIADDKIPFLKNVLEPFIDVEYYPGNKIDSSIVRDADALIIRTRTKCNADLLDGSSVKLITTATIGFDHIDTTYCKAKGIKWTNAPGCNSGSVMQYIAAALVFWAKQNNIVLGDRTIGVVGVGNVGSKVARLAEGLGMRVLLNDPPRERVSGACGFVSLKGILRDADIITTHVPLNIQGPDRTFHLVDKDFLSKLNPGTLLINTSRGEVVNTDAILKGFSSKQPENYIFDVWENEPDINLELLENAFLASPHIAGYSADGKANGTAMSVQAISKFFGLGIDDWEPDCVPSPTDEKIELDAQGRSFQDIATEVILKTYPIMRDNEALKNRVTDFEKLRGDYPIRREFAAYTIKASNMPDDYRQRFMRLGFKLSKV